MAVEKPKIQYVREFYSEGSTARKLDLRALRPSKPEVTLENLPKNAEAAVDPVAIVGIVAAIVLLITMAAGLMQIQRDWDEYYATSAYLTHLHSENTRLTREYQASYELDEIRGKAVGLGLVPVEDVKTMDVTVTMPLPKQEPAWQERLTAFWDGLWA